MYGYIIMSGTCALVVPWHVSGFDYATGELCPHFMGHAVHTVMLRVSYDICQGYIYSVVYTAERNQWCALTMTR